MAIKNSPGMDDIASRRLPASAASAPPGGSARVSRGGLFMPGVLAAILSLFLAVGCTAARPEPARIHEDAYERKIRD